MAMSSQAAGNKPPGEAGTVARGRVAVHPVWLRLTHWLNALAVVLMVLSGWRIYNASPIFDFRFPRDFTLGGWLGGALQWHFAAMWLLAANGVIYLALNTVFVFAALVTPGLLKRFKTLKTRSSHA